MRAVWPGGRRETGPISDDSELRAAWTVAVGDGPAALAALDDVVARHREPHRRYHGVRHVTWVVRHVHELAGQVAVRRRRRDRRRGVLPRRGVRPAGRRQRGAQRAPRRAGARRSSAGTRTAGRRSGRWSGRRRPTSPPPTTDTGVLLDADLAVLGAEPAAYQAYVTGVRAEYAHVAAGRLAHRPRAGPARPARPSPAVRDRPGAGALGGPGGGQHDGRAGRARRAVGARTEDTAQPDACEHLVPIEYRMRARPARVLGRGGIRRRRRHRRRQWPCRAAGRRRRCWTPTGARRRRRRRRRRGRTRPARCGPGVGSGTSAARASAAASFIAVVQRGAPVSSRPRNTPGKARTLLIWFGKSLRPVATTATFAGTSPGMTSGVGLAMANTMASSAMSVSIHGSTMPGPDRPSRRSDRLTASWMPPVRPSRLPCSANQRLARRQAGQAAVQHALAVEADDVADADLGEQAGARRAGGAGADDGDRHVGEALADDPRRVQRRGEHDDGRAVLVVVEDRDVDGVLQPALDLEARRGGDVLEVDAAERRRQRGADGDELVDGAGVDADRVGVDAGELLEQHGLALHDRQRGLRADVAEAEDRRAVGQDGDGVAPAGVAATRATGRRRSPARRARRRACRRATGRPARRAAPATPRRACRPRAPRTRGPSRCAARRREPASGRPGTDGGWSGIGWSFREDRTTGSEEIEESPTTGDRWDGRESGAAQRDRGGAVPAAPVPESAGVQGRAVLRRRRLQWQQEHRRSR